MSRGLLDASLFCLASLCLALMLVIIPVSAEAHQAVTEGIELHTADTDLIELATNKTGDGCHPAANCSLLAFVFPGTVDMTEQRSPGVPRKHASTTFSESFTGFEPPPPR